MHTTACCLGVPSAGSYQQHRVALRNQDQAKTSIRTSNCSPKLRRRKWKHAAPLNQNVSQLNKSTWTERNINSSRLKIIILIGFSVNLTSQLIELYSLTVRFRNGIGLVALVSTILLALHSQCWTTAVRSLPFLRRQHLPYAMKGKRFAPIPYLNGSSKFQLRSHMVVAELHADTLTSGLARGDQFADCAQWAARNAPKCAYVGPLREQFTRATRPKKNHQLRALEWGKIAPVYP